MNRVVKAKRTWALTAAAAAALAVAMPALANADATSTRAVPPALTLDFTGHNDEAGVASGVGVGFGGAAVVKDSDGKDVGTAYDSCDKDAIKPESVTAFCNADIVFHNGSQVTFDVVFPIQDPLTAKYPKEFDGVITGGTGEYRDLRGAVHFTNRSLAVYDVTWNV